MLAIADIGFFANMAYTRVQRKILEIRLSDFGLHAYKKSVWIPAFAGMTVRGLNGYIQSDVGFWERGRLALECFDGKMPSLPGFWLT